MSTQEPSGPTLNRRTLLKTVAAGAFAVAKPSLAEENSPVRFRKAVKFRMVAENLSVLDKFKLLADLGFEGTEIHVTDKVNRDAVRRASEKTGVRVHGFLNSSQPDLKTAIDAAKFYGGDSVLVVAGRVTQENPYHRVYAEQQERLRAALPYAEQQGIRLLVENVWNNFLLSPLEMARFLDELDSPAIGAYFDVGNVVRFGWPEHWIAALGPRIAKLDVKEFSRAKADREGPRQGFAVEIGEGDCDWPAVRRALAAVGFKSGWATAEVRGGDRSRLRDIKERMDRVLGP